MLLLWCAQSDDEVNLGTRTGGGGGDEGRAGIEGDNMWPRAITRVG
jgi:hypothetical protein